MARISEEWHEARMKVLNKYWGRHVDTETLRREIAEVDKRFRNRDKYDEWERERSKKNIEMYKQKIEKVKEEKWWRRLDNDA